MGDPDLQLIFSFVFALTLLAAITAQMIHRRMVRHDEAKLELEARIAEANAAKSNRGADDYRNMEERLRVLERIATDSNHALASQIEELRDLHTIEDRTRTPEATQ